MPKALRGTRRMDCDGALLDDDGLEELEFGGKRSRSFRGGFPRERVDLMWSR